MIVDTEVDNEQKFGDNVRKKKLACVAVLEQRVRRGEKVAGWLPLYTAEIQTPTVTRGR